MLLTNGLVFNENTGFTEENVYTEGSRIADCSSHEADTLDCTGKYVLPGLVDIHTHGALGRDFCMGDMKSLETIAAFLAGEGVTSFLGTNMAMPREVLLGAFAAAGEVIGREKEGLSVMRGINMEGPFISKEKRGAHPRDCCIPFDKELFDTLSEVCGHNIRIVDICPEEEANMEAIGYLSEKARVSLAHTAADYDTAVRAFDKGASHVTHLFNGMSSFGHREPGVPGAAADRAEYAELICDGIHVHPSAIRAAFRMFGAERICMVSDSILAAGLPDGDYEAAGFRLHVENGKATLPDGAIAGASTSLAEDLRRAVSFGIPLHDAVRACTVNPARAAGIFGGVGSLEKGKRADILVLNDDLSVYAVILGGKRIK